jgi:hypothetical protein
MSFTVPSCSANVSHALIPRDTQSEPGRFVNSSPAVGTNAAIAMKRASACSPGSSEIMRGCRSSRVKWRLYPLARRTLTHGPPGWPQQQWEAAKDGRNCIVRSQRRPRLRRIAGSAPVTFPPGWLKVATRPIATGSTPIMKTTRIVEVAALVARAGRLLPGATRTVYQVDPVGEQTTAPLPAMPPHSRALR